MNTDRSSGGIPRGTIRELDGLRGIAILMVMVHHFWPREGYWATLAKVPHLGWIGVDLFFVVSGLLITGILLDTRESPRYFRNFYVRRALRIFPLYYVFLLLMFVGIPLLQGGPWATSEFVRESGSPWWYILYQGNLREAITGVEPAYVLAPLWSLSIEEQFYLVFPLTVFLLSTRRLRQVLIGAVGFALLFRIVSAFIWPLNERVQYLSTPARVDALAIGALLAIWLRSGAQTRMNRRMLGGVVLLLAAVSALIFGLDGLDRTAWFGRTLGYSVIGMTFGALVLWAVTGREGSDTAWLRWKPLRNVGMVCYGVYLLQRPVQVMVGKVASGLGLPYNPDALYTVPLLIVMTLLVAGCSWVLFERPILGLKRHFSTVGHPQENKATT